MRVSKVICLGEGEDELVWESSGMGVDELGKSRASITTAVKDGIHSICVMNKRSVVAMAQTS